MILKYTNFLTVCFCIRMVPKILLRETGTFSEISTTNLGHLEGGEGDTF